MAKVKQNVVVQGLSGTIGKNLVFRHMKDGRTIVSVKQDFSNRVFSKGQLTHQSRFQEAATYARQAAKTQPIYAELAKGTMKTAYNIALSDWFNPPMIQHIERRAGKVRVEASDNVRVTKVRIKVLDEAGKVVEQGEAVQLQPAANPGWWEYAPHTEGQIAAEAWDLAGNVAQASL